MTIDDFLQKLRDLQPLGGWQLRGRFVRCNGGRDCPVSWVGRRLGDDLADISGPYTAAARLRLDSEDAAEIIHAADGSVQRTERTPDIRARLLDACGLTEPS